MPQTDQQQSNTVHFLFLGALEALINQALQWSPESEPHLAALEGNVIRVRGKAPAFDLYFYIDRGGIEVLDRWQGRVDIRVSGLSLTLLYQWLAPNTLKPPPHESLHIKAQSEAINALEGLINSVDIVGIVRTWLTHYARIDGWGGLSTKDHELLASLRQVPKKIDLLADQLSTQAQHQKVMLEEMRSLRESLQSERRTDLISITIGMASLTLALLIGTGSVPYLAVQELQSPFAVLFLTVTGLTLMLSRFFGKRYSRNA